MDYQVWSKEEFGDTYKKVDCGDLAAAKRELDQAVRKGGEPILTVEVPYSLSIKVEEPGAKKPDSERKLKEAAEKLKESRKREANQSETKPDQSPGA